MAETKDTLESYIQIRKTISKEEFLRRYAHPFLVQKLQVGPAQKDDFEFTTMEVSTEDLSSMFGGGKKGGPSPRVLRVVKRATNAFGGMINVGRAHNNDIVLDSAAISKFHAFFSKDAATGAYCITEANSTNGTYINGHRLLPHKPHTLQEGDVVSFGRTVEFTYYSPRAFYDMLGFFSA
jgi:hypothetical protein